MRFRVVVFAGLAAIAANASAQTSAASGEVIALQREVFGQPSPLYEEFPAAVSAQLALANAYAAGDGIERDVEFACGLAQVASDLAGAVNEDKGVAVQARRTRDEICAPVPDRQTAFNLAWCPKFGLEPQVIDLGNGARLQVTRTGWAIDALAGRHEGDLGPNCNGIVASMRHLRIDPPPDSIGSVRQFVELFFWHQLFAQDGTPVRNLGWQLWEFDPAQTELIISAGYQVLESNGSIWPAPPVPLEFIDGPLFETLASGAVRWRFERGPRSATGVVEPLVTR